MKADKLSIISKSVLIALFVAIGVSLVLFFVGDPVQLQLPEEIAKNQSKPLMYPEYTDILLILCYVLSIAALVLSVVFGIIAFVKRAIVDPLEAIKGLVLMLSLALVTLVSYLLASSLTDAILYIQYILLVLCMVCWIIGMAGIKRAIAKK